jgi:hypothetical protein
VIILKQEFPASLMILLSDDITQPDSFKRLLRLCFATILYLNVFSDV